MTQSYAISKKQNETSLQGSSLNRFLACEEIVDDILKQGIPTTYVPQNLISKISKNYNISFEEAKTCLKLAVKQNNTTEEKEETPTEELYAQSGYYYPSSYSKQNQTQVRDGMDSLSMLGAYNQVTFKIR